MASVTPLPKTVLVIDDEDAIVKLIENILRSCNYRTITATQWTDAVDAIEHDNPNLVLLDLKMPHIDGYSVLQFIRQQGNTIPVVIVSAYVTGQNAAKVIELGADAVIPKPFHVSHLTQVIEHLIGPAAATGEPNPPDQSTPPASGLSAASAGVSLNALYEQAPEPAPEPEGTVQSRSGAAPEGVPGMDALYTQSEDAGEPSDHLPGRPASEEEAGQILQKQRSRQGEPTEPPPSVPENRPEAPEADLKDEASSSRTAPHPAPETHPGGQAASPLKAPVPERTGKRHRRSYPPPRPTGGIGQRNLILMGIITLICVVVGSLVALMQQYSSSVDLETVRTKARDLAMDQAKEELLKSLTK